MSWATFHSMLGVGRSTFVSDALKALRIPAQGNALGTVQQPDHALKAPRIRIIAPSEFREWDYAAGLQPTVGWARLPGALPQAGMRGAVGAEDRKKHT